MTLPLVLIVDDSAVIIQSLVANLSASYDIRIAITGGQALHLLEDRQLPDLILLDAGLPDMPGYEVCAALKAEPRTSEIPVIFVTASEDVEVESKAISAGAVDLVAKPINMNALKARISLHMSLSHKKRQLEEMNISLLAAVEGFQSADRALKKATARELEFGARLQSELLFGEIPQRFGRVQFSTRIRPSRGISGDLITFTATGETSFDILLGDVMGKGVTAALLGAGLKAAYRKELLERTVSGHAPRIPDLVESFKALSDAAFEGLSKGDAFSALFMMRVDTQNGQLTWIDAGMPPAIHYSSVMRSVTELQGTCLPIGIDRDQDVVAQSIRLERGDAVVVYSDGLTDQIGIGGEMYGDGRLMSLFKTAAEQFDDCNDCLSEFLRDFDSFAGMSQIDDDQTILLMRIW